MTCGSCGATLEAHARFCPGCGAAVATTEPASQEHSVVGSMAGREIAGRYRILEKIGEGGMGTVEIKRYRVLGQRTWGGIYEKDDDFRLEAIFCPAVGYVLAVSIGTQTGDFNGSEAFRRDFFDHRVRLK